MGGLSCKTIGDYFCEAGRVITDVGVSRVSVKIPPKLCWSPQKSEKFDADHSSGAKSCR